MTQAIATLVLILFALINTAEAKEVKLNECKKVVFQDPMLTFSLDENKQLRYAIIFEQAPRIENTYTKECVIQQKEKLEEEVKLFLGKTEVEFNSIKSTFVNQVKVYVANLN